MKRFAFIIIGILIFSCSGQQPEIVDASQEDFSTIQVAFKGTVNKSVGENFSIEPEMAIRSVEVRDSLMWIHTADTLDVSRHWYLKTNTGTRRFIRPDGVLNRFYSKKKQGLSIHDGQLTFRLFAPRARWIKVKLYKSYDEKPVHMEKMIKDKDGMWEISLPDAFTYRYYGYSLYGPQGDGEMFDSTVVIADPFSRAMATKNTYRHEARSLILRNEPLSRVKTAGPVINPGEWLIYEMHVRDLTAHSSSGVAPKWSGSYKGLVMPHQKGGLPYIRSLGVNAIELLPVQEFGNIEIPFQDQTAPVYNTWNPYARNHWGYMTSGFFAPESYYASGNHLEPGKWSGTDGRQVDEFALMVETFHQNGIAVLMDVVYNHVSQYDYNAFKYIDKFYYFRVSPDCQFKSVSGCGNDFKTERPMARRMILESIKYWMTMYKIDGFRFDLAYMIDWDTCDSIRVNVRKINPHAVVIAEPWGGGYGPDEFSHHGWAAWNDKVRDGIKGRHPLNDYGFALGRYKNGVKVRDMQNYFMGTLKKNGGLFQKAEHAVNYLASHDDHTLGDFIRLALGKVDENERVQNIREMVTLTPEEMRVHKLAALMLFSAAGNIMIHEGQEFARSKIIAQTPVPDTNQLKIDHNSYNKDNETNYLNFEHAKWNRELVEYYQKLVRLRKKLTLLSAADTEQYKFMDTADSMHVAFQIRGQKYSVWLAFNGSRTHKFNFTLPDGKWKILADSQDVYLNDPPIVSGKKMTVEPQSGIMLIKGDSTE